MKKSDFETDFQNNPLSFATSDEKKTYKELKRHLLEDTIEISGDFWNWPLVSYLTIPSIQRLLHINHIYDLQLGQTGSIMEFGVHYGSTMIQLMNMRAIKEPYNYSRHIYGFDTFEGFDETTTHDAFAKEGDYFVAKNYEKTLEDLCILHERLAPKNQINKSTILKGDASVSLENLLTERKDIMISMALFDLDLYKPTKDVLELLIPRLHKGSVLVFDELNCPEYPGETEALREVLDLNKFELKKSPFLPFSSILLWNI